MDMESMGPLRPQTFLFGNGLWLPQLRVPRACWSFSPASSVLGAERDAVRGGGAGVGAAVWCGPYAAPQRGGRLRGALWGEGSRGGRWRRALPHMACCSHVAVARPGPAFFCSSHSPPVSPLVPMGAGALGAAGCRAHGAAGGGARGG